MCRKRRLNEVVDAFLEQWILPLLLVKASRLEIILKDKIEKVPRGIRGEKSSKDMASSRNLVSTIGAQLSPTM